MTTIALFSPTPAVCPAAPHVAAHSSRPVRDPLVVKRGCQPTRGVSDYSVHTGDDEGVHRLLIVHGPGHHEQTLRVSPGDELRRRHQHRSDTAGVWPRLPRAGMAR